MLKEPRLFGDKDLVAEAIATLREHEPPEGYYLAFSGGKDSIVIKKLADMASVKYDAVYSVTTIDPPPLVKFIHRHHPDVHFDHPKEPFLTALVRKGFPIRQSRWCCELYKERGGSGRLVLTGIRRAESKKRNKRKMLETSYTDKTKTFLHIILDWSDAEVWEFIKSESLPYCELYDEGWKRIGCLLCPFAGDDVRQMEAEKYPSMTRAFIRAFEKLYADRKARGLHSVDRWANGQEMFDWWLKGWRKKR
jgi:phosphoadenosine phosphosulfate reductase